MYNDKTMKSIAEAAKKVMDEQLKGDQHKIDKNKNNKIDAHDFKLLRKEKGLEEGKMGQLSADLTDLSHADFHKEYGKPKSHFDPTNFKKPVQKGKEMDRAKALAQRGMASMKKEEVEELEEMFPGTPEYEKKYGKAPQDLKKGEKKKTSKGEMEGTGKGVVHKRKFSEMIETYVNGDIKDLLEALDDKVELIEEPTNDEFTAELEKAKAKATGKDKANVAAAATQSVKEIDEEFDQLDERELTPGESKEKERIVKGMKKGLEGFKDRYGDRAKEVMYATATKQAMKEESDSEHYKAGHDYASDHAQDSGFKVTARARKKEMLADNPHKKGTPEHSDWHRGANDGHQMALDNM
jgi:hypothetical protein